MAAKKGHVNKAGKAINEGNCSLSEERLKRFKKAFEAMWLKEKYRKSLSRQE